MTVRECTMFLQEAYGSDEITREMKAMTGTREIVKLGRRHGYDFDIGELAEASSAFGGVARGNDPNGGAGSNGGPQVAARPGAVTAPASRPERTAFYHHEYSLDDTPALAAVADELSVLKVRPPTVDLAAFDREFRVDDLRSTSRSPSDPDFQRWHRAQAARGWRDPGLGPDAPRRDFHLINLDEHIDYPGYEEYFDAKVRAVSALEEVFGGEVRLSGSLWYPPNSYRLWHTNETQPGWRMYVVDFDVDFDQDQFRDETSFFRYQNPQTGELVTLQERPRIVRFFKAEQDPRRLFWHCIVNPTARHRWSYGFVVPEHWMECIG